MCVSYFQFWLWTAGCLVDPSFCWFVRFPSQHFVSFSVLAATFCLALVELSQAQRGWTVEVDKMPTPKLSNATLGYLQSTATTGPSGVHWSVLIPVEAANGRKWSCGLRVLNPINWIYKIMCTLYTFGGNIIWEPRQTSSSPLQTQFNWLFKWAKTGPPQLENTPKLWGNSNSNRNFASWVQLEQNPPHCSYSVSYHKVATATVYQNQLLVSCTFHGFSCTKQTYCIGRNCCLDRNTGSLLVCL